MRECACPTQPGRSVRRVLVAVPLPPALRRQHCILLVWSIPSGVGENEDDEDQRAVQFTNNAVGAVVRLAVHEKVVCFCVLLTSGR